MVTTPNNSPENAPTTPLLGTAISCLNLSEALAEIKQRGDLRRGGFACFVNVHSLTESVASSRLSEAFRKATFCFPDGKPLVWLSMAKRQPVQGQVCGPDFLGAFLKKHPGEVTGIIGGYPDQDKKLGERFGVRTVGYSPPYRALTEASAKEDWETFLLQWKTAGQATPPKWVWIALGAPKQELWMATVSKLAPETFFLGIGAALDFHSGDKQRAPIAFRALGLEWFYRLCQEPRRLFGRYAKTNWLFIKLSLRELFLR